MALAESAGAAWATSATGTVVSGTIAPAAGDLLVALISCGNGAGGTNTAISVSNTTLGGTVGTWSQLTGVLASSSGGGAWVFIADAGSAPSAGTITATLTGTAKDTGVIVRRFAGAAPVASQNGATATLTKSSVKTLSVTPAADGSQIVGADGQDGTTAFVANAATSIYAQTNGGQGDRFCAIEGTALTTAGVAQVLGFTSTVTQNGLVLAEILAAAVQITDSGFELNNPDPPGPGWFPGYPGGPAVVPFYVVPVMTSEAGTASAAIPAAGLAAGTSAAQAPVPAIAAAAGLAAGTGTAQPPVQDVITVNAGLAAGTGAAQPSGPIAVAVNTAQAAGTGAAQPPAAAVQAAAGLASGTGFSVGAGYPSVYGPVYGPAGITSSTAPIAAGAGTGTGAAKPGAAAISAGGSPAYERYLAPLYIYPNPLTPWTATIAGAPVVQYIIANPASGPGISADPNWTAAIAAVQAAGITVLGYVDTSYTTVPTATVSTNIGLWQSLYGVTNIFFDQVSSDVPSLPYYRTTTGYVHATPGAIVMLNHGTTPDEGYASAGDVLLVFENNVSAWPPSAPAWFSAWPRAKFAAIIYNVIGTPAMQAVASQAAGLNIGVVNITDEPDDLFNALPGYMAAEFTALAALTAPGQSLAAGVAQLPQPAVRVTAATATAAGAAQSPAVATTASVTASASLATSSAAAQPPAVSTVPIVTTGAGLATAASTAQPPGMLTAAAPARAAATSLAQPPAVAITLPAGAASGAGTAQPPAPQGSTVPAPLAAGTGAARAPAVAITCTAAMASATGTAQSPPSAGIAAAIAAAAAGTARQPGVTATGSVAAPAQAAASTAAAQPAATTLAAEPTAATAAALADTPAAASGAVVTAGLAAATGIAAAAGYPAVYGPVYSPAGIISLTMAAATGTATGTAQPPATTVVLTAATATAASTAQPPAVATSAAAIASATAAAGTGAAKPPAAAAVVPAAQALSSSAAQPPGPAVTCTAALAPASGTAQVPAAITSATGTASAGLAPAAGTAQPAVVVITVTVTLAAATGAAPGPSVVAPTPGPASAAASAGAAQQPAVTVTVTAALAAAAGAAQAAAVNAFTGVTGTVTWVPHPARPRWQATPEPAGWQTRAATCRWRIIMTAFHPIAAISLEYVNVTWTAELAGTVIDPTGQSPGSTLLVVQFAFPVSSGNPLAPAEPGSWYAGRWLDGTTSIGYIAQCLAGPDGTVLLSAGTVYDVWGQVQGTPEVPMKFAGQLAVF